MKIQKPMILIAVLIVLAAILLSLTAVSLKSDANLVAAIAGIWVAVATLILALVTAASTIESHRQSQYAQRSLHRPLLMPINSPNPAYFPNEAFIDIEIENMGQGVALNIWGLLMPSVPETSSTPLQYSIRFPLPLAAGSNDKMRFGQGGTLFTHQDNISGIQFGVPKELSSEEAVPNPLDRRDRVIARLTITYSDIYGYYHASVYNYTKQAQWLSVAILEAIPYDLGELDKRKGVAK